MRLDVALTEHGLTSSRSMAQQAIAAGLVTVNSVVVTKSGATINDTDAVALTALPHDYVSRGGLKLAHALDTFCIDVAGLTVLDIGVSTGGFTDCLLRRGARRVIAVDVGRDQLHPSLRDDPRAEVHEQTDIRSFTIENPVALITGDVSFISLTAVIPVLERFAAPDAQAVLLVKPQFETPKNQKNKRGVVKAQSARNAALRTVTGCAEANGWQVLDTAVSPITGGDGNIEYLLHLSRKEAAHAGD